MLLLFWHQVLSFHLQFLSLFLSLQIFWISLDLRDAIFTVILLATLPPLLHFIFISLRNHCLSLRQGDERKCIYRNMKCRYILRERRSVLPEGTSLLWFNALAQFLVKTEARGTSDCFHDFMEWLQTGFGLLTAFIEYLIITKQFRILVCFVGVIWFKRQSFWLYFGMSLFRTLAGVGVLVGFL